MNAVDDNSSGVTKTAIIAMSIAGGLVALCAIVLVAVLVRRRGNRQHATVVGGQHGTVQMAQQQQASEVTSGAPALAMLAKQASVQEV